MKHTTLIHMMAVAPVVTEYLIWILFVAFRLLYRVFRFEEKISTK